MTTHQQIMESMKSMAEKFSGLGVQLDLPPPSNKTLGTEYIAAEMGKSLTAKFLFNPLLTNPLRMYQGGFLCGAFDDVFGPLTYMAAEKPVVTLEMSSTFIRPFTAKDEFITIQADVVAKTKSVLILKAEAKTKDGKLIATAHNHSLIVTEANLKKS